ncbi:MAG: hypothetical protein HYX51_10485 [Chloroflexi bacterium]|nr:hypothetical protein [Chloroflexota bacterium]
MAHDAPESRTAGGPVRNATIERVGPLVLHLAHEIDPAVQVTLSPYRWHGEDMLDIGLAFGHHEHHLQVSASRLEIIERDPHILEHDIEGAVHDMRSDLPASAADEAGQDVLHTTSDASHTIPPTPSAEARGVGHGSDAHATHTAPPPVGVASPTVTHTPVDAPHVSGATDPRIEASDRAVLDRTVELVRELLQHLDHDAAAVFEEYHWHGELTLDVAVSLGGHVHHYEVTAERAALFLRDHEMLHHDLEGVLIELRREQGTTGDHAAAHEA